MSIFRWLFAFVGLMRGRLWGALLGYWLGSMVDMLLSHYFFKPKAAEQSRTYGSYTSYSRQNASLRALMATFAHVIHADGRIMHSEMEYVRRFLRTNYGEDYALAGEQTLLELFREKKNMTENAWLLTLAESCALLRMQMSPTQRMQLIQVLVQIAAADGTISEAELQSIRTLAVNMGLNADVVDAYTKRRPTVTDDYRTLGISPTATDEEVRQAYRKLALQHHPDRVANQGEAAKAKAERTFRQITEAKERIFKARGLK